MRVKRGLVRDEDDPVSMSAQDVFACAIAIMMLLTIVFLQQAAAGQRRSADVLPEGILNQWTLLLHYVHEPDVTDDKFLEYVEYFRKDFASGVGGTRISNVSLTSSQPNSGKDTIVLTIRQDGSSWPCLSLGYWYGTDDRALRTWPSSSTVYGPLGHYEDTIEYDRTRTTEENFRRYYVLHRDRIEETTEQCE